MPKKTKYNRIRIVLVEKEKTNEWLARELGVNKTTVSRWCTNSMQPTMERLFEIARALEVDVCDLLVSSKS